MIRHYLDAGKNVTEGNADKEVFISNVIFRGEKGENSVFKAGKKAMFESEVTANVDCNKLSVSLTLVDDNSLLVFNTSTERLSHASFSLKGGQTKHVTFQLDLHLLPGTYHFGAYIYRYDIEKMYDTRNPAATIHVKSDADVRGIANLYPKATLE